MMTRRDLWTTHLNIRPEVIASDGGVSDLQMSLHKAVYQTVDVPYRDVTYFAEITEPTPNLVGFYSRISRRLSGHSESEALYHLDQGMGGGKSHALVGLYHMAAHYDEFRKTDIGVAVAQEAQSAGATLNITDTRIVTLTADHFSPGKPTEVFGPATTLFERFLWRLVDGKRDAYDTFVSRGANKATVEQALRSVSAPVLILLDELMDYVLDLSDVASIAGMPGEQAFLNALMDACDDVPRVAFVMVMIKSELDPEGYSPVAESFREYVSRRINRNGTSIAVTESGDFAAIIRKRIFERTNSTLGATLVADAWQEALVREPVWTSQVMDRLGTAKGISSFKERVATTYPFHPDLMDLVRNEWAKAQGFQRVRSTVSIFALAALHWTRCSEVDEWVPALIGVGDLPVGGVKSAGSIPQARCLDALLNSGLLLGNDRAIQGYRAVATTDITAADGQSGRAVEIDRQLRSSAVEFGQPAPAVRMSTALFNYSLIGRSQGKRGATKAELLASLLGPTIGKDVTTYAVAEETFASICGEQGLGALEISGSSNNANDRYWLTVKHTLRMYFGAASSQIDDDTSQALVWETAKVLASTKGPFDELVFVEKPSAKQSLLDVASGIDSQVTRLIVLDPRYWTLLNGEDNRSRQEICRMLGIGADALIVDNAASAVFAAANTYQRKYAVQAAHDVLTWRYVRGQVVEDDERAEVDRKLIDAEAQLKEKVRSAYRHLVYLSRRGDDLEPMFRKLDNDKQSSLSGPEVWSELVTRGRAIGDVIDPSTKQRKKMALGEVFVSLLLDGFDRYLTLKDVLGSFYSDPRFPLVPTTDDIRTVIFDMLQPAGHAGANSGGWQLVGLDGVRLHVESAKQLAIGSAQIQLRRTPDTPGVEDVSSAGGAKTEFNGTKMVTEAAGENSSAGAGNDATVSEAEPESKKRDTAKVASYSWYRFEITNQSIVDPSKRSAIRRHLLWLANQLDDVANDNQLVSLKYDLMASTSDELASDITDRGAILLAKVTVEPE